MPRSLLCAHLASCAVLCVCHSEINTLLGNINWMKARSADLGQQCDFNELVRADTAQLLAGATPPLTHCCPSPVPS